MADIATVMNVFRSDAFSTLSLTQAVARNPYLPIGLGAMDLFEPEPIKTTAVMIEQYQGKLTIIPTSARGSPPVERVTEKRQARYFGTVRLAHGDTITASELQNVVDFDAPDLLMELQREAARRLSGPTGILSNIEYTKERHRLGAIQGIVLDANDTVIYNWFEEFDITPPSEVVMNLLNAPAGTLRPLADQIKRGMIRAAQGCYVDGVTKINALCGDEFFDAFTNSADVRTTYLNWLAAATLRESGAFEAFPFYGINWINYRGSDDTTTIAIPTNKAKFFLQDAPGLFRVAWSPAESFEWVNKPGLEQYVVPIFDNDRNSWFRQEAYSYPLYICTRPETLFSATMDATAD
jgi:hypothetical protein